MQELTHLCDKCVTLPFGYRPLDQADLIDLAQAATVTIFTIIISADMHKELNDYYYFSGRQLILILLSHRE